MNKTLSKYIFYYPATILKGEAIWPHLKKYEQFQFLSHEQIKQYQSYHLKKLLTHAYNSSEYYRDLFTKHNININKIVSVDDIAVIPMLSKAELVNNFSSITSKKNILTSKKTTGGSTGQAVTLLKNADALARERAATWRSYAWAGISIGDSQARFWGTPLSTKHKLQSSIIDFIANRIRLSAFDITAETLHQFYNKIHRFKPAYLYGYTSMLEMFSNYIIHNSLKPPSSIKSVVTTSEVLTESTRKAISDAFNVNVFNEYGCGEVGSIAHECEYHNMHTMDDNLIVEIVPRDSDGGEIVVTDLFNYATPLIRYKVGDFASPQDTVCQCGRSLGTIGGIHGRAYDCIQTADGKTHHPEIVMYIFEKLKNKHNCITQFQLVQTALNKFTLHIVKGVNYTKDMERIIVSELRQRLHPEIEIKFQYPKEIKREKSGKIRLVKSDIHNHD